MIYWVFGVPLLALLAWLVGERWLRHRREFRRQQWAAEPFPEAWLALLERDFPLYGCLPLHLQQRLQEYVQVFVREKVFVGCADLQVTDEMRVLIAAQACLLILNNGNDFYPTFKSILIYPESYQTLVTRQEGMLHSEQLHVRAGESWQRGPVILAWDQVWRGAINARDGHNVVLHEFAHKLDEENPGMDGLPILRKRGQYQSWAQVLSAEYDQLCQHTDGVIDPYGATSAAEFFAVVTETFFERPRQLHTSHPQLYQQFQLYYQMDPLRWPHSAE